MNEALGFIQMIRKTPGGYGPSPLVDLGWHTAVLYTREYEVFCFVLCGRFLQPHAH
jgi:hypothetical protein